MPLPPGGEGHAVSRLELALEVVLGGEPRQSGECAQLKMPPLQKRQELVEPDIENLLQNALAGRRAKALLGRAPRAAEHRQDVGGGNAVPRTSADGLQHRANGRRRAMKTTRRESPHKALLAVEQRGAALRRSVREVGKQLPRETPAIDEVRPDGRLDSVTLLNLSIGDTDEIKVRLRNPVSECAVLMGAKDSATRPLAVIPGASPNERVVVIDNIPGWQICTVFIE